MQFLIPQVVSSPIVDRYDIWVNTNNTHDIEFFKQVADKYPKINLVWQPEGIVNGIRSINAFYKDCIEDNTIYIKLDDDVVWLETDFFEKIVRFRIENPEYFLVSPLVINNAISTYILQNKGKIKLKRYMRAMATEKISFRSGYFAAELHDWFLTTQLPDGKYKQLYSGKNPISLNRFSINAVLWFGETMKKFQGIVTGDDEEYLSVIKPAELGLSNCIDGNTIISHFAFRPQRKLLDKKNILKRYGAFLRKSWADDHDMKKIDDEIQQILTDISARSREIGMLPPPYREIRKPGRIVKIFRNFSRILYNMNNKRAYIEVNPNNLVKNI